MFKRDVKKLARYLERGLHLKEDCIFFDPNAPYYQQCSYYWESSKHRCVLDFERCEGVCKYFKLKRRE